MRLGSAPVCPRAHEDSMYSAVRENRKCSSSIYSGLPTRDHICTERKGIMRYAKTRNAPVCKREQIGTRKNLKCNAEVEGLLFGHHGWAHKYQDSLFP